MLFATASQAALERSSTGRTRTWFRTPTRPLSRLYPRNVALRAHPDLLVLVHDPAGQFLPCLQPLDDDHPDGVVFVVHHEMNHEVRQRPRRLPAFGSTGRVQSWMLILRVGSGSGARTDVLPSGPSR